MSSFRVFAGLHSFSLVVAFNWFAFIDAASMMMWSIYSNVFISLTIFVENNQGGNDISKVHKIILYGTT